MVVNFIKSCKESYGLTKLERVPNSFKLYRFINHAYSSLKHLHRERKKGKKKVVPESKRIECISQLDFCSRLSRL